MKIESNVSSVLISEKAPLFEIVNNQLFIYLLFYVPYKYHISNLLSFLLMRTGLLYLIIP